MKLEFLQQLTGGRVDAATRWRVFAESDRLTDVVLSEPTYLAPVPCCSATIESLAAGFETDVSVAMAQHRQLRRTLESLGVRCHMLPAMPDMPDLCFTRDTVVTTPCGPLLLNPALPHRQREVEHMERFLMEQGAMPIGRIEHGHIEGGDVCVARDGLLIVGQSGVRTDAAGVAALRAVFEPRGWEVLVSPFDPRHLHLDTLFCMLDDHRALACVEWLAPPFLEALAARGIEVIEAACGESRGLGCNIVSIDGDTLLVGAGETRLHHVLRAAGFAVIPLPISQFAACGGGLHCLTMPIARG